MTIGVIFHTEDEVASYFNHDSVVWENTLDAFGVEDMTLIDRTVKKLYKDWDKNPNKKKVAKDVKEATKQYPGMKTVLLSASEGEDLRTFKHPKNALYIIDPDTGNVSDIPTDHVVHIDTKTAIWGIQVLPIVLYDRSAKEKQ